jgi:WD40 repeat protein
MKMPRMLRALLVLPMALACLASIPACGSSKPEPVVAPPPPKKTEHVRRGWVVPQPLTTIPAHETGVSALAFSPDARFIVTGGSDDGTAKMWDLAKHAIVCEMGQSWPVTAVAFSPDGKRILTASSSVKVTSAGLNVTHGQLLAWDLPSCGEGTQFMPDARLLDDAAFSPDGKLVAGLESKAHKVRLFDATTGAFLRGFDASEAGSPSMAFFPDGKTIVIASEEGVDLVDVATGTRRAALDIAASDVVVSPDGTLIVTTNGPELQTWDASGRSVQVIKSLGDAGTTLAFAPDGRRLASGAEDGTIKIWDPARGTLLQTLRGHDSEVTAVAYSKDGALFASAGRDGAVQLWSIE